MMGMKQYSGMTAQAVMESIITQSISGGPASAEDLKAATLAKAQAQESSEASRSRASQQPPPTSVHDQQQSSSSHKPTLPPDPERPSNLHRPRFMISNNQAAA